MNIDTNKPTEITFAKTVKVIIESAAHDSTGNPLCYVATKHSPCGVSCLDAKCQGDCFCTNVKRTIMSQNYIDGSVHKILGPAPGKAQVLEVDHKFASKEIEDLPPIDTSVHIPEWSKYLGSVVLGMVLMWIIFSIKRAFSKPRASSNQKPLSPNSRKAALAAASLAIQSVSSCDVSLSMKTESLICYNSKDLVKCDGHIQFSIKPTVSHSNTCFQARREQYSMKGLIEVSEPIPILKKTHLYNFGSPTLKTESYRWCAESGKCDGSWKMSPTTDKILREDYTQRCGFWTCNCASAVPSCVYSRALMTTTQSCEVYNVEILDIKRNVNVWLEGKLLQTSYKKTIGSIRGKSYCEVICDKSNYYYGNCNDIGQHDDKKIGAIQVIDGNIYTNIKPELKFSGFQDLEAHYYINNPSQPPMFDSLSNNLFTVKGGVVEVFVDDYDLMLDFVFNGTIINMISNGDVPKINSVNHNYTENCKYSRIEADLSSCISGLILTVNNMQHDYYCRENFLYTLTPAIEEESEIEIQLTNPISTAQQRLTDVRTVRCVQQRPVSVWDWSYSVIINQLDILYDKMTAKIIFYTLSSLASLIPIYAVTLVASMIVKTMKYLLTPVLAAGYMLYNIMKLKPGSLAKGINNMKKDN